MKRPRAGRPHSLRWRSLLFPHAFPRNLPSLPIAVLLIALGSSSVAARSWRGSLSGGWHLETNVREALEDKGAEDDALIRLLFDLQTPPVRFDKSVALEGRVRAGLDRYARFVEESRWLAEGRLQGQWGLGRGRRIFMNASAYQQTYPDSTNRDFRRFLGEVGYRAPMGPVWVAGASLDLHSQDYLRTSWHDETGWGLRLSAGRTLGSNLTGEAHFRIGEDFFGRQSLKAVRSGDETTFELGLDQKDSVRGLGLTFRRTRPFVARLSYILAFRRSNSFGFSFRRHDLSFLVSVALPWEMDVQAMGTVQFTQYTDSGIDTVFVFRSGEDVEGRESNNSLTLQVRRHLGDGPMAELRCAWHRNESLLVDRFYSKWVLGAAIRWGFRVGG